MNYKQLINCLLVITILLCTVINSSAQNNEVQTSALPNENVILQWNRVLMETLRTPGVHPGATIFPIRSYAMMHGAMFDAVNSIDKSYTPYLIEVPTIRLASVDAAAAQAAHGAPDGSPTGRTGVQDKQDAIRLGGQDHGIRYR